MMRKVFIGVLLMSFALVGFAQERTISDVAADLIETYMVDELGQLITEPVMVTEEMQPLFDEYVELYNKQGNGPSFGIPFWYFACCAEAEFYECSGYDVWECIQKAPNTYGCGWASPYGTNPGRCTDCGSCCIKAFIMIL